MTKKKKIIIAVICWILLVAVSGVMQFLKCYDENMDAFCIQTLEISNDVQNSINYENIQNYQTAQYNLIFSANLKGLNAVYAVLDSDGNLIAKSTPCLIFKTDGDNDNSESVRVELKPYITDEMYKKISAYYKEWSPFYPSCCSAGSASIHKDGDKLIPVELILDEEDKKSKIKLTDYTPDFTVTYEKNDLEIYNLREEADSFYKAAYDDMDKNVDKFIAGFDKKMLDTDFEEQTPFEKHLIEKINPFDRDSWHRGYNGKILKRIYIYDDKGEKKDEAVLYLEYSRNIIHDTLTSWDYYESFLIRDAIFIIAGIVLAVSYSKDKKRGEVLSKSRNAFISAAAHELKTPLAVIANNCECVLENVSPEKNTEYVTTIYDESKRMSKMVKTLLEYNNLTTDGELKKEKINFSSLIDREIDKFKPLLESKQIELLRDIPENTELNCDEKLIDMVVSNFLSNAVKFTPEKGKIKITVIKAESNVSFMVFNTGSKVSKEDAPHIWDELYTGSESRSRDENSTGMGLAVSRVILEMHGFTYGFRNTDHGVRFYFDE